jgi:signal peptidase I
MKDSRDPGVEKRGPRPEKPAALEVPVAAAPAAPAPAGRLLVRWFLSSTVRHALQMRKHVDKLLSAQRDLLSAEAIEAMRRSLTALRATCVSGDTTAIKAGMDDVEKVANHWLKPHPYPSIRENIEVLLVAIAIAMAIRTFFLQPFKIPTGSMQPTLWGITSNPDFLHDGGLHDDLKPTPDFQIPGFLQRWKDYWVDGVSYTRVAARSEGALRQVGEPVRFLIFDLYQQFWLENDRKAYTVLFPPDSLFRRAGLISAYGLPNPKVFKPGEEIIKMRSVSGDHLFVDRLTYNFRRPERGEIVVFETRHVHDARVPTDQFYIKRLVGLSDETLKINPARHLVVNGKELTASTPRFENLYSFDPKQEPPPNCYYGHGGTEQFANEKEYHVAPYEYVVMGDNTRNSLDSRYWGSFPREDVIGKAWFVYWPISTRFGWGYR